METTKKILQILNHLASIQPGREIDEMKAYKLIWLIDRYHLRQFGRTVTGDSYNAMPRGVVPYDAKCIVDSKRTKLENDVELASEYITKSQEHKYKSLKDSNMRVFSESDVDAINVILGAYGNMNYKELPTSLVEGTITENKIYFFRDASPIGIPKHMHVCIKKNGKFLFFSTCTSQQDTVLRLHKLKGFNLNSFPCFRR